MHHVPAPPTRHARTIVAIAAEGWARALLACLALGASTAAEAAPPSAAPALPDAKALLRRYDEVLSPVAFEADTEMTAHREDGTTRTYKMHVLKAGADKLRATFTEPASARGQEMLRNGDNLWLYMPNLKRAVRIASRDQFMGGDFNNADVLRVHYQDDYDAAVTASDTPGLVLLELKARGPQVAYDRIRLWMSVAGGVERAQPVRAEYFAASGKLIRSAQFLDVKELGKGWARPTRIQMKNELQPARWSEMAWSSAALKDSVSGQRFTVDDLGR